MNQNYTEIAAFWFRRDLRLDDNTALYYALISGLPVLPVFIFDSHILSELEPDDARVTYIHQRLTEIQEKLSHAGRGLLVRYGEPLAVWKHILQELPVKQIYINHDYEPYAVQRDNQLKEFLGEQGIGLHSFKDQVIFEKNEIVKEDGQPYSVYTPYSRKWLESFPQYSLPCHETQPYYGNFLVRKERQFPSLKDIGFHKSQTGVPSFHLDDSLLNGYKENRNFPAREGTTLMSTHLRFGTTSIRKVIKRIGTSYLELLKELIWREFFMQIMHHFPRTVDRSFKREYDNIAWINNENDFEKWCSGETGYPLVYAGMR